MVNGLNGEACTTISIFLIFLNDFSPISFFFFDKFVKRESTSIVCGWYYKGHVNKPERYSYKLVHNVCANYVIVLECIVHK